MTDEYFSIAAAAEGLYKDKGSKFIGYIFPVGTAEEAKALLARVKKEHYAARHWCYAYRLGADKKLFRSSDDGEPPGTAGKPILNQIIAADLSDVLLVVVRYFGGTLLGTGGLITAYRSAAAEAIKNSSRITKFVTRTYVAKFPGTHTNEIMRRLKELDAQVLKQDFTDDYELTFSIRLSHLEKLLTLIKQNNLPCRLSEI